MELQLQYICTLRTEAKILERLGKLPKKLEQIYNDIYTSGMEGLDDDDERAIATAAFRWLLCSRQTLSGSNLSAAVTATVYGHDGKNGLKLNITNVNVISTEYEVENALSADHILQNTFNLIVEDAKTRTFRFPHLSVREHFETMAEYNDNTQNHAMAALTCLKSLNKLAENTKHINRKHFASPIARTFNKALRTFHEAGRFYTAKAEAEEEARDLHWDRKAGHFCNLWFKIKDTFWGYATTQWPYHCEACPDQRQSRGSVLANMFEAIFSRDTHISYTFLFWNTIVSTNAFSKSMWDSLCDVVCEPPNPAFTLCAFKFFELVEAGLRPSVHTTKLTLRPSEEFWASRNVRQRTLIQVLVENGGVLDFSLNEGRGTILHMSRHNYDWMLNADRGSFIQELVRNNAPDLGGRLCPCGDCEILREKQLQGLPFLGHDSDAWSWRSNDSRSHTGRSRRTYLGQSPRQRRAALLSGKLEGEALWGQSSHTSSTRALHAPPRFQGFEEAN